MADAAKNEIESMWYLYLIRLKNGHLYTGITTDISRRFTEHQAGKGAKYLRGKGELNLVFSQKIGDRSSALKLEAQVKKMAKREKEKLVNGEDLLQLLSGN